MKWAICWLWPTELTVWYITFIFNSTESFFHDLIILPFINGCRTHYCGLESKGTETLDKAQDTKVTVLIRLKFGQDLHVCGQVNTALFRKKTVSFIEYCADSCTQSYNYTVTTVLLNTCQDKFLWLVSLFPNGYLLVNQLDLYNLPL